MPSDELSLCPVRNEEVIERFCVVVRSLRWLCGGHILGQTNYWELCQRGYRGAQEMVQGWFRRVMANTERRRYAQEMLKKKAPH